MKNLPLTRQLTRHRHYFGGLHLGLVIDSMMAGNTAGQLWDVAQEGAAPLLLLWDKGNNVIYLAGDSDRQSSLTSLAAIVATQLRPQAVAEGVSHFKMHALSSSLEESLPDLFPDVALRESPTLLFTHDSARQVQIPSTSVPNVVFAPVTRAALTGGTLAHSDSVREEIRSMWPSEDRFYQHGFGVVAVLDEEIICWCTAEYASAARCGIGIATSPHYERRGVATATAAHFVREAHTRGITPYWECQRMNHGSVRVAEKVGFERRSEEVYWRGSFVE